MPRKGTERFAWRNSFTGRFVSAGYAKRFPHLTEGAFRTAKKPVPTKEPIADPVQTPMTLEEWEDVYQEAEAYEEEEEYGGGVDYPETD